MTLGFIRPERSTHPRVDAVRPQVIARPGLADRGTAPARYAVVTFRSPGGWTLGFPAGRCRLARCMRSLATVTRASAAYHRLMTIPGVGQLTAVAFVAAINDSSRIRRYKHIGAHLGLVLRHYQSGEANYVGGVSKCGDRRMRTLLYEAANVMLTRYKGSSLRTGPSRSPGDQRCERPGSLQSSASARHHHARDVAERNRVRSGLGHQSTR